MRAGRFFPHLVVVAFPAAVILYEILFFIVPFLMSIATALLVGSLGVVATGLTVWKLVQRRRPIALAPVLVVLVTWLSWWFWPEQNLSVRAKFAYERHNYDLAVSQVRRGERPTCLAKGECLSDGMSPPYLVFPFPGFLSGWVGVVYVPNEGEAPKPERLANIAAAANCDPTPIAPHYYVCGFS